MTRWLRSSEWEVTPCERREAVKLVDRYHCRNSPANTCGACHGLRHRHRPLLRGAAPGIPPLPPAGKSVAGDDWRGVLVLSRLVVIPSVPTNGASFLLGRSMKLIDRERWPVLLTYADTRLGHTGAIYKATNWECLGEVPAGDVWVNEAGMQRGRRRGPKVLTAAEMRDAGFERMPSYPKVKFVHRVSR
jgi:hypothetical protein